MTCAATTAGPAEHQCTGASTMVTICASHQSPAKRPASVPNSVPNPVPEGRKPLSTAVTHWHNVARK